MNQEDDPVSISASNIYTRKFIIVHNSRKKGRVLKVQVNKLEKCSIGNILYSIKQYNATLNESPLKWEWG